MSYSIKRAAHLDDMMNWLNTLGGGFSALGDHFEQHVRSDLYIASFVKCALSDV